MKTKTINLYSFDELSEEAKEKAISSLSDINVNYEWWESTYEDAKNIGLKITSFDLDRNRHAEGKLIWSAIEVMKAILKEHGENCETFKTAKEYHSQLLPLIQKQWNNEETDYDLDEKINDLSDEFLKSLLEDYSIMLQKECDYLQSSEAIIETIKANEYDFTENGELPKQPKK